MNTEYQMTPEERAYDQLLDEHWVTLSEAARTVLQEADSAAYAECMVDSYCFQPREYDEALEKMRFAAARITEREQKLLTKLWRAALGAAASIDVDDVQTLIGRRLYPFNLHWRYRMFSGMVERVLQDKEVAEREPEEFSEEDFDDIGL